MDVLLAPIAATGRASLHSVGEAGRAFMFFLAMVARVFRWPVRWGLICGHIYFIGNRSVIIVLLTSSFTGMVLVLQGYYALVRFGSEVYLGPLVALSLVRELGPVLAALMVTARAGSAMAATIAGMRVTEQIDAMEVMAVDSVQYLATTRFVAAIISMPLLTVMFDLMGIGAAYGFAVGVLGVDPGVFMGSVRDALTPGDIVITLNKALVFGCLLVWVSCYQGYSATNGALGIGRATTNAVVLSSILILACDYVMTAVLI
ncbi:MAG: MlaE family lipid ABC transporter permease subunit [Myxococcales bacterium]|nr:MlaE family lipid ABC transporter permease subunit [Myxococcales bacterium]